MDNRKFTTRVSELGSTDLNYLYISLALQYVKEYCDFWAAKPKTELCKCVPGSAVSLKWKRLFAPVISL